MPTKPHNDKIKYGKFGIIDLEGGGEMAITLEIRDWQKRHLTSLLKIKRAGAGQAMPALVEELENAVAVMEQEDVAYCEKIIGVKAF